MGHRPAPGVMPKNSDPNWDYTICLKIFNTKMALKIELLPDSPQDENGIYLLHNCQIWVKTRIILSRMNETWG